MFYFTRNFHVVSTVLPPWALALMSHTKKIQGDFTVSSLQYYSERGIL